MGKWPDWFFTENACDGTVQVHVDSFRECGYENLGANAIGTLFGKFDRVGKQVFDL